MKPEARHPERAIEGELSVEDIHYAVMRESADPDEAYDPGPKWFYAMAIVALAIGGFYLGRHMGTFGTTAHIGYLEPPAATPATTAAKPGGAAPAVSGASIYASKCASCHQADGKGLPGAFPPLTGSPYVVGDVGLPVRIVLHGLTGPVTVESQTYNGVMPAWADQLSDAEIAGVVSYIRGELGANRAAPVTPEIVAELRKQTPARTTPWTVQELEAAAQP